MNAETLPHQTECIVFCCKSSYYDSSKRKWISGRFFLRSTYIAFVEETHNESSHELFHLYIPLIDITSIQRKQSTFVFAAIIVMLGSTVHWFSSFPNRDSIFNLLELFWRQVLLSPRANLNTRRKVCLTADSFTESGHTKLGSELLSIAHESEQTLAAAASMLESQGRQLEESENLVEDINNDLSVVESLINTMSFWHGNSKSKPGTSKNVVSKQNGEKKLHQIVFSSSSGKSTEYNIWLQGKIEIKDNEVCLLDLKDQLKYCFHRNELSKIQVVSPWKLKLHKKCGVKNSIYEIMCPALSTVLNVLVSVYQDKIVYEEEKEDPTSKFSILEASLIRSGESADQACADIQMQEIESLSADEIRELTTILTNLQSLAVDVGKEQEAQLERIDHLVTSVDKTDTRMKADISNIKELT